MEPRDFFYVIIAIVIGSAIFAGGILVGQGSIISNCNCADCNCCSACPGSGK